MSRDPSAAGTKVQNPYDDETAAHIAQPSSVPSTAPIGTRFEPITKLGEGGQGEVWLARDPSLGREVALKVIRSKLRHASAIRAQFQREAEVTGKLEHPNIVPIYELGTCGASPVADDCASQSDTDGAPYYVMRVYHEQSLHEAITEFHKQGWSDHRLRELLSRFVDVCNAVGYAHSRGVIHRDLKPQNVMLGEFGETLVVDWGLAKVVGRDDSHVDQPGDGTIRMEHDTNETAAGSIVGTPSFMSPEQARGEVQTLGPPTDIYGLGGILYVLLTGQPPVQQRGSIATLEFVRAGRIAPPETVNARVPPALAAICRKALAKEPLDRYQRAEVDDEPLIITLANDVTRWLNDASLSPDVYREPILARSRRWLRRHQSLATSTAAGVLVAVATLSIMFVIVADRNRSLSDAYKQQYTLRQESETQKKKAVSKEAEARGLHILAEKNAADADEQREKAESSADDANRSKKQAETNAADADRQRKEAVAAREQADVQRELAETNEETARKQTQLALNTFNTVIFDIQRGLQNVPGAGDLRKKLLGTAIEGLGHIGHIASEFAGAGIADRQTSVALSEMAETVLRIGLSEGDVPIPGVEATTPAQFALVLHERANGILVRLAAVDRAQRGPQRDLLISFNKLGEAYENTGDSTRATEYYIRALEIADRLVESNPEDHRDRHYQAVTFFHLGKMSHQTNKTQQAIEYFKRYREICGKLVNANPNNAQAERNLAIGHNTLGEMSLDTGDLDQAVGDLRQALRIRERLVRDHPTDAQLQRDLSGTYDNLGRFNQGTGEVEQANNFYHKALEIRTKLVRSAPNEAWAQGDMAISFRRLGDLTLQTGIVEEAISYFHEFRKITARLAQADQTNVVRQYDLMVAYYKLGDAERTRSAYSEATSNYLKGIYK